VSDGSGDDGGVFIDGYDRIDWKLSGKLSGLARGAFGVREVEFQQALWVLARESARLFRRGDYVHVEFQSGIDESFRAIGRRGQE
jgi:hypothetical protein